jgi:GNAT superfamily N-acetyltransferase
MMIRNVQPSDYTPIIKVLDDWWGGRNLRGKLPRLFFEHFNNTSFVLEQDDQIVAFLIGFLSQSLPQEAYTHFVGVHPNYRLRGYARLLYERFFEAARQNHRNIVRCVTAPINRGSIAFHTHMSFEIEPGTAELDGTAYTPDYDGPGDDLVRFVRRLEVRSHNEN